MPRPTPLRDTSATGRSNSHLRDQVLTPRTPHSRAGRAEEALHEIELDPLGDDEYRAYRQQQTQPLLSSSEGYRSRGDDYTTDDSSKWTQSSFVSSWLGKIALTIGIGLCVILLGMSVVSYERPETLQYYMGVEDALVTSSLTSEPSATVSPTNDVPVPSLLSSPPSHPGHHPVDSSELIIYENYTVFPLTGTQYKYECNRVAGGFMSHGEYWAKPFHGPYDVLHADESQDGENKQTDYHPFEGQSTKICARTLTYQLDGNVGLLADLALMSQAAALAEQSGRTFLVDDTYWNRGKWLDHFQDVRARQPGPEPGCRAPPPEELVACPRSARHWVINSQTAKWHLGHPFSEEFEDPYKIALNRLKPIFEQGRSALFNTIRPNAQSAALIHAAREELRAAFPATNSYIGAHVRRGDSVPVSWRYHNKPIPISVYTDAITKTLARPHLATQDTVVYIASDDPDAQNELANQLTQSAPTPVYSLRQMSNSDLNALASPRGYVQAEFAEMNEVDRVRLTRGMLIDFALLSGMWAWDEEMLPQATVCTIKSSVCRLSALGYTWEGAFGDVSDVGTMDMEHRKWVEIDAAGEIAPAWEAFGLF